MLQGSSQKPLAARPAAGRGDRGRRSPVTSSPHSPRRLRSPSLHLVPPWRSAVRALNGQRSATAQAKRGWSTRRGPRGLKSAVRRRDTCSHRVRDALLAGTECKHQFPPVPSIDPLRSHILSPPSRTSASVLQSSSGLEKSEIWRVHTVSIGFARRCAAAHTVSIGRSRFY